MIVARVSSSLQEDFYEKVFDDREKPLKLNSSQARRARKKSKGREMWHKNSIKLNESWESGNKDERSIAKHYQSVMIKSM